jgi:hypothetical protein
MGANGAEEGLTVASSKQLRSSDGDPIAALTFFKVVGNNIAALRAAYQGYEKTGIPNGMNLSEFSGVNVSN